MVIFIYDHQPGTTSLPFPSYLCPPPSPPAKFEVECCVCAEKPPESWSPWTTACPRSPPCPSCWTITLTRSASCSKTNTATFPSPLRTGCWAGPPDPARVQTICLSSAPPPTAGLPSDQPNVRRIILNKNTSFIYTCHVSILLFSVHVHCTLYTLVTSIHCKPVDTTYNWFRMVFWRMDNWKKGIFCISYSLS